MFIRIDQALPDPLYRQIRDEVVRGIAQGELAPGDALPSVRNLASDLGINLHTVNKAYALLRDEGVRAHARPLRRVHRAAAGTCGGGRCRERPVGS